MGLEDKELDDDWLEVQFFMEKDVRCLKQNMLYQEVMLSARSHLLDTYRKSNSSLFYF